MVGGVLVPMQLPDGCATAQVVGQSARAAGAPRYEDGPRGDLYHGRINSPGVPGLPVPSCENNYAYHLFHTWPPFQGVGRGARPAAPRVSEEERTAKPHCGRCMSAAVSHHKAVNEGATYRICMDCYFEWRASGEQDSKEVWECPSAAQGKSDCLCSCAPLLVQAAAGRKQRKSSFSSSKKQNASRKGAK
jgi:hypothetical protein